MIPQYKVLEGNCLDVLSTMETESINCIVTSPPYFGLRIYSEDSNEIGREENIQEYINNLVSIFSQAKRVLRQDGILWLNLGDCYSGSMKGKGAGDRKEVKQWSNKGSLNLNVPNWKHSGLKDKDLCMIPARVAIALQENGWWLRSDIIWYSRNKFPESCVDRCSNTYEHIFMLTKNSKYYYDKYSIAVQEKGKYKNKRNVWDVPIKGIEEAHYASYPIELVTPCILAGSPTTVCGSCNSPYIRVVEKGNSKHHCRPGCGCNENKGQIQNWEEGWFDYGGYEDTTNVTDIFVPSCNCQADNKNSVILDPFCGSGTTGVAAMMYNRDFIGIELNPEYVKIAEKRIEKSLRGRNETFDFS